AAAARLDPARGRLVQAALVTASDGAARLVLVIHHLGVDAVSWSTIIEDLVTVWAQRSAGHRVHLREVTTSQRAWSQALADRVGEHAAETGYWLDRLPVRPTHFGTDLERGRDRVATAGTVTHRVDASVTEALLAAVPEAFAGNVNDALLAGLARAIRSWQSARGIVDTAPVSVLLEGHGRYEEVLATGDAPVRADLSRSVGWFTSIAPMNLDPGTDPVHAVKAAKEERLAQPHSGLGFGWLRYHANPESANPESANPESGDPEAGGTELSSRPLPSIVFNYLGAGGGGAAGGETLPFTGVGGPSYPSSPAGGMAAQAALTINAGVEHTADGRELVASMIAPSAVLSAADLADLGRRWSAELAAIVAAVDADTPIGLSPADVPGVDLTQADLDALAARFPGADVWPLSPLQSGLFFQAELAAELAGAVDVYVAQAILTLDAGFDADRLRTAGQRVLDEHRVLRSGFVTTGSGATVAVVVDRAELPWAVVDLEETDESDVAAAVAAIARRQLVEPFDLAAPPLLRFVLVRHGDTATLIATNHHLILDGWSGPLVLADVLAVYATGATYTGQAAGGATGDFGDYLRLISARDTAAGLDAWRRVLAPVEGPTLVSPAAAGASEQLLPQNVDLTVGADLLTALEAVGRAHGATLATVLQSAWAVLLSRLTGNRVVTFGETVSGRPADLDGVEAMVGLFINTLPAVVDVDPDATVGAMLERLQADKVAVLDHQHLNLPEIAAAADAPIGFDTLTVHESYPVDADSLASDDAQVAGGLVITDAQMSDATHYPLNMITMPAGDGLTVRMKYLPAVFTADQARTLGESVLQILSSIAADAAQTVADIALASPAGVDAVLALSFGERVAVPPTTLGDAVAAQIRRTPKRVAVWFEGREVSYREFGARVATLAHELIAAGVGPDVAVGVAIDRSVEMMVAIHAVIAAGGQYVPIDTAVPADRAAYMVETAGVRVVLVAAGTAPESVAALDDSVRVIAVDAASEVDLETAPITDADRLAPLSPDHAAYTLFTSGSTGRPKGVTVSHRSVVNRLAWGYATFPWTRGDRVIQKTPFTFDVSVPELFGPLFSGATIIVARPGGHADPDYLLGLLEDTAATSVHFVPSMLSVFLDVVDPDRVRALTSLKWLFASGEALPPAVVAKAHALLPHIGIHNLFGPTEAAVEVTWADVSDAPAVVSIGKPVWNTEALVLDSRLRPVPAGVPGELYLGGVQLARAYADQPRLTAERFVADPFGEPGARLYRIGDLVRWNADGDLEYLGRTDFQVKLRGQRIELGEVEAVLAGAPGVVKAAVTVASAPAGGEHLVAYLSPATVDVEAVRAAAAHELPGYMVPTVWTV
ncbi:MAG: amino acid adenylation domain-containing protein, partial [Gordonia sp. (in: high G+C Gram-positive bacteria)]|uniref:amino acid adenylation domain-containing protein n=1 Tax=Gordonia sp. (in: high G+C Gram-positive bacteria) TaxID=84139 RepID=UPI003C731026